MVITSGNGVNTIIKNRMKQASSQDVTVDWSWYDATQGTVSWNFKNNSNEQKSVVLYRSGYYFGNAFWPIYVNNGMTSWATTLSPLIDNGITNNTMPIGIIDFGNGNRIIAFIFTFSPGQSWSVLEGGFSAVMPPSDAQVFEVTLEKSGKFCIGYDYQQVLDWDLQTQTTMTGYTPNPDYIATLEVEMPSNSNFVALFNDTISDSSCPAQPNCIQQILQGIQDQDIQQVVNGIMCLYESGQFDIDKFMLKMTEAFLKHKL